MKMDYIQAARYPKVCRKLGVKPLKTDDVETAGNHLADSPRRNKTLENAVAVGLFLSGLRARDVARGSGVAEPAISRWLSGRQDLTVASLEKLRGFLRQKGVCE